MWTSPYTDMHLADVLAAVLPLGDTTVDKVLHQMYPAAEGVIVLNQGRDAIALGLRLAGLPSGSSVVIPTVVCQTVIDTLLQERYCPVIVDVADDLQIDPDAVAAQAGSVVVLAPHIHGIPAAIRRLARDTRDQGQLLIEDAAQSYGVDLEGLPLGSFGDMAILSFGPQKSLASTRGGALVLNRPGRVAWQGGHPYDSKEAAHDVARRAIGAYVKTAFPRLADVLRRRARGSPAQPDAEMIPDAAPTSTPMAAPVRYPLSAVERRLLGYILRRGTEVLARRTVHAGKLAAALWKLCGAQSVGPNGIPYRRMPIRFATSSDCRKFEAAAAGAGVWVGRTYVPLHRWGRFAMYRTTVDYRADNLWERTLVVSVPDDRQELERVLHRLQSL
jgi:hypothetical protein